MSDTFTVESVLQKMKKVRQIRQYTADPVPESILNELLEIARWTGSARNTQPWRFIVINDKTQLAKISQVRTPINWVATAPLAIAIVLDGASPVTETYDEGRISERLLLAAHLLGLGGGTAWYGDTDQQANAKQILGIPAELTARSAVAIGYPLSVRDPRPGAVTGGRKPLSEQVTYNTFGLSEAISQ